MERQRRHLRSRRGEVRNLVQERLCSARHHLQDQQLVVVSLEKVDLDLAPNDRHKRLRPRTIV